MGAQTIVIQGTLRADGKLDLQEPLALPPGPVEVTVRAVPLAGDEDILTLLGRIRAEQQASGRRPRTREEIDSDIQQMRDEWLEHPLEVENLTAKMRLDPDGAATESAP